MEELHRRAAVVAVVAVVSAGAAACGSSSSSKTTAKTPAASTPATPSTSSTTTQPQLTIAPSTPVGSSQFKAFMGTRAVKELHATEAQATKFAECYVPKLEALGIKTAGEYKDSPDSKTGPAQSQCVAEAGIKR